MIETGFHSYHPPSYRAPAGIRQEHRRKFPKQPLEISQTDAREIFRLWDPKDPRRSHPRAYILARLAAAQKTGERAAYTELTFAARLVKAGFQPVLEPPFGDGFLDARIPTVAGEVYCEVIAPETSDAMGEVKIAASALAAMLRDQNRGRRVEVLLSVDIDESISSRVAEAVRIHPDSNEVWPLEAIALISKRITGDDPNVGPTIPSPEAAAIIGAAQSSIDNGVRTAGIVRVPVTDTRAKRLLYGESHHFSRNEMNILIMDVTRVVSSLKVWRRLIEKCFQPEQNRRFGAIVLFSAGISGEKMAALQEWKVVRNPYAYKPIPESLLEKIVTLESSGD